VATPRIRTLTQLAEAIDAELGWRKRELSYLKTTIVKTTSFAQVAQLRASVALLYAHWEGFVVACLRSYMSYVAEQREPLVKLIPSIRVGAVLQPLKRMEREQSAGARAAFLIAYELALAKAAELRGDRLVDAESNLNSSRFLGLVSCVGFDGSRFESSSKFLDESLLARRNAICHGEAVDVDVKTYSSIESSVIALMEQLKNEALDHAQNRKFKVA
jgi:hypothetical protein